MAKTFSCKTRVRREQFLVAGLISKRFLDAHEFLPKNILVSTGVRWCTVAGCATIPSAGVFRPTVIDKSWPIESIGSRLRDHTRTFVCGVRARSASRRTPPAEGIAKI